MSGFEQVSLANAEVTAGSNRSSFEMILDWELQKLVLEKEE